MSNRLIKFVSLVVFVVLWVSLGKLGQSVLDIQQFAYIMVWGFITGLLGMISMQITESLLKK